MIFSREITSAKYTTQTPPEATIGVTKRHCFYRFAITATIEAIYQELVFNS
ncbi:MAG: hypothetical protein ACRC7U_07580 [Moraxella sp.]